MSDTDITAAILADLKARADDVLWACELPFGYQRRCDFWELRPQASKGFQAHAYEIKVSRGDWRRDSALKQREARLFSDFFWYVAPKGLIVPEEIPDWAGLKEWAPGGGSGIASARFSVRVPAPYRDKEPPSWELIIGFIRNCGHIERDTGGLKKQLAALRFENARLKQDKDSLREMLRLERERST